MRKDGNYHPSEYDLKHIQAVLQLLNVMDEDHRFEEAINASKEAREARNMSEWLSRVIDITCQRRFTVGGCLRSACRDDRAGIPHGHGGLI